jgi:hypothetical protein
MGGDQGLSHLALPNPSPFLIVPDLLCGFKQLSSLSTRRRIGGAAIQVYCRNARRNAYTYKDATGHEYGVEIIDYSGELVFEGDLDFRCKINA